MEIYRYLLDLLPTNHLSRMTIITACNRLANKCSINLEDEYKPLPNLSSRDYPKATAQISAFDVDEALNMITIAENLLHIKNVHKSFPENNLGILFFSFSFQHVNKQLKSWKNDQLFLVRMQIVFSSGHICTISNRNLF